MVKQRVKDMNPRQRAKVMISIREQHAGRTPRAQSMDARQTANRVLDPDTDSLFPWQNRPNRYDVLGVDDKRVTAKPALKAAKKDELGREIVYEVVSKYGKGIGWYRVVKLPIEDYGIHQIEIVEGKELDSYAGRETSLTDAKKTAKRYMGLDELRYAERIEIHRDKLHNVLDSNVINLHEQYSKNIKLYENYVRTCNEEADRAKGTALESYYHKQAEAAERSIVNIEKKQRHLKKLEEQHEKKDKLYLLGNKKLIVDARMVLKEDFGITDAEADRLFTPNLKLEYSKSRKFGGRCFSAGSDGFPLIQISSIYHKSSDIEKDREYRATMIHELIHYMRLWELDRAKFSPIAQHELLKTVYDRSEEEQHTVMETQLRGAPKYCSTSRDSYYQFLKNIPKNVGEEDNKTLTGRKDIKKVIDTKEISKDLVAHGDKTHIAKLVMKGRSQWIDRTQVTSEGDVVRIYDPKARKPDMLADAQALDAEDGEIGEEDVFEIMQNGTKKLIIRRNK
jgi:hypothetical protein